MFYELSKKLFKFIINLLKFVQVALIFLSFFTILYWLLDLGGLKLDLQIISFFESIKAFIHTFYTRVVVIDDISVDFSFLLAIFLFLLTSWGLKFVIEYINIFEQKYDSLHTIYKNQTEKLFNIQLEQEYLNQEYKNNKFLILIKFSALNLKKRDFFSRDNTVESGQEEVEIEKKALEDFLKNIKENLNCQTNVLDDGVLLYFNCFNDINKILFKIETIISILKQKYREEQWNISYLISLDIYSNETEINSKIKKLIILTKLSLKNKIACLATFKHRYSLIKNPKYTFESQGVYEISKNEEVFTLQKSD